MNKVALAILAHPDDIEFLCAGTLMRLIREHGWTVHAATMTAGDCGSVEYSPDEIARIRRQEAKAGAELIGATYHCLEAKDLRVHFCDELIERTVKLMAKTQASVVFTHSPDDYHMDHEMTSKVVRAASFAAPIPNYLHGRWEGIKPLDHIPHLYYCDPLEGKDLFGRPIKPNFWIEITKQLEDKEKMLACHASQRNWLLKHHGVDDYLIAMRSWAEKQGVAAKVPYAEGFRQHLGHSYPQDNIIGKLLGAIS